MDFQTITLRDGTQLEAPMRVPMTGNAKGVGQVGYQVFLQENTKGILLHMEAINRATKMFFSNVDSVLHPFGGLGMAAQCMDRTLGKELHHAFWERDKDCCDALKEMFNGEGKPAVYVAHTRDSFADLAAIKSRFFDQYDLIYIDPTAMTVKKELLWDVWANLSASTCPNFWFVDSAMSKIWLHTKTYSEFFGSPVADINDYFRLYNARLWTMGLKIVDLCREGTVVYATVQRKSRSDGDGQPITPCIIDLR